MEANIDKFRDKKYDITSSDSKGSSGNSKFQFHNKSTSFTGRNKFNPYTEDYVKFPGETTPTGVVLNNALEAWNRKVMFKKNHTKSTNIDLRNVILLDIKSTMDLFYNIKLVRKIYKEKKRCAFRVTEARCSSLTRPR